MPEALRKLVGLVTLLLAYGALFGVFWASVLGAARLGFASRREAVEDAGDLLREAPGRCWLAGIGFLVVGWLVLAGAGRLGPLGVLLLLWWIRQAFRGLLAWILVRGEELQLELAPAPGSAADALRDGVRTTALASALPVLGWALLVLATLQGAGAESLRAMGRRVGPGASPAPGESPPAPE